VLLISDFYTDIPLNILTFSCMGGCVTLLRYLLRVKLRKIEESYGRARLIALADYTDMPRRMRTRSSIGGWVMNNVLKRFFLKGLAI